MSGSGKLVERYIEESQDEESRLSECRPWNYEDYLARLRSFHGHNRRAPSFGHLSLGGRHSISPSVIEMASLRSPSSAQFAQSSQLIGGNSFESGSWSNSSSDGDGNVGIVFAERREGAPAPGDNIALRESQWCSSLKLSTPCEGTAPAVGSGGALFFSSPESRRDSGSSFGSIGSNGSARVQTTPTDAAWGRGYGNGGAKSSGRHSWWLAKPAVLSPVECALRGWSCVGVNRLQCGRCAAQIEHRTERDPDGRIAASLLQNAHDSAFCPWHTLSCQPSFRNIVPDATPTISASLVSLETPTPANRAPLLRALRMTALVCGGQGGVDHSVYVAFLRRFIRICESFSSAIAHLRDTLHSGAGARSAVCDDGADQYATLSLELLLPAVPAVRLLAREAGEKSGQSGTIQPASPNCSLALLQSSAEGNGEILSMANSGGSFVFTSLDEVLALFGCAPSPAVSLNAVPSAQTLKTTSRSLSSSRGVSVLASISSSLAASHVTGADVQDERGNEREICKGGVREGGQDPEIKGRPFRHVSQFLRGVAALRSHFANVSSPRKSPNDAAFSKQYSKIVNDPGKPFSTSSSFLSSSSPIPSASFYSAPAVGGSFGARVEASRWLLSRSVETSSAAAEATDSSFNGANSPNLIGKLPNLVQIVERYSTMRREESKEQEEVPMLKACMMLAAFGWSCALSKRESPVPPAVVNAAAPGIGSAKTTTTTTEGWKVNAGNAENVLNSLCLSLNCSLCGRVVPLSFSHTTTPNNETAGVLCSGQQGATANSRAERDMEAETVTGSGARGGRGKRGKGGNRGNRVGLVTGHRYFCPWVTAQSASLCVDTGVDVANGTSGRSIVVPQQTGVPQAGFTAAPLAGRIGMEDKSIGGVRSKAGVIDVEIGEGVGAAVGVNASAASRVSASLTGWELCLLSIRGQQVQQIEGSAPATSATVGTGTAGAAADGARAREEIDALSGHQMDGQGVYYVRALGTWGTKRVQRDEAHDRVGEQGAESEKIDMSQKGKKEADEDVVSRGEEALEDAYRRVRRMLRRATEL